MQVAYGESAELGVVWFIPLIASYLTQPAPPAPQSQVIDLRTKTPAWVWPVAIGGAALAGVLLTRKRS